MKSSPELVKLLHQFQGIRPLVLGDIMLDRYTWGDVERISPEAPVPVLRVRSRETRLGGAANVCGILQALGATASCVGVVGRDAAGDELTSALSASGVRTESLLADDRCATTVKERFLGHSQGKQPNHVLRVDDEPRERLSEEVEQRLIEQITAQVAAHDVLLISDYAKGVCSRRVLRESIAAARRAEVPVMVDPAPSGDFHPYRGVDVIKPNRKEAGKATGMTLANGDDAVRAARRLCSDLEIRATVVTLDRDGMVWVNDSGQQLFAPTTAQTVCDVTGAGDAVFAMLATCLTNGVAADACLQFCNLIGELAIERMGAACITTSDLRHRLLAACGVVSLELAASRVVEHRRRGQRIVFTNGCFDLMHIGHVRYLAEASEMGDVLIVGLNSDASVKRLKGEQRPVISEEDRGAMLSALQCVDYVVIYDEDTPHRLLETLRPDVLVKGGTYSPNEVVGREVVERYGGEVRLTGQTEGISTTRIIESLQSRPASTAGSEQRESSQPPSWTETSRRQRDVA